ncbi:LacI family transcriptional regulator [Thalassotalea sp. 42_200_T64]|nr:LacI family transcriptional regulator [Thalassotalea sp. 42_200_T64]
MATIYQVSELAGVSLATVSRVMNNNTKVSDKTRAKVLQAMEELGYRPNAIAQSLASNRTNSVGVLVSELDGPFFGQVMEGIENELRLANKHVIITSGHSEEEKEKQCIEFLISRRCDALILQVDSVSDEYLLQLSTTIPTVLINRKVDAMAEFCTSLDNEQGGYLATKALIDKGHKSIAYIGGPDWKADSHERFVGHQRALTESGIEFNDALYFQGNFKETDGRDGFRQLMSTSIRFTGLACGNDEMASGAMKAARACGLVLPNDLSVVGFDNVTFARYLYPELTTIDNSAFSMGKTAAEIILKSVYKVEDIDIQNVFEPKLIDRNSIEFTPELK